MEAVVPLATRKSLLIRINFAVFVQLKMPEGGEEIDLVADIHAKPFLIRTFLEKTRCCEYSLSNRRASSPIRQKHDFHHWLPH